MSAACRVAAQTLEAVVAHAREAAPAECCGVLIGRAGEIAEAFKCRNLSENPNRFLIDPKDHFEAIRQARLRGLEVLGFYHSHPHSGADPSATDVAEASYPDHLYLIVGLSGQGDVRLYRFRNGAFDAVAFEVKATIRD